MSAINYVWIRNSGRDMQDYKKLISSLKCILYEKAVLWDSSVIMGLRYKDKKSPVLR